MENPRDRRVNDNDMYLALGRIEEKLNHVEAEVQDTKQYARDISTRVRSLEVSRGWLVGTGAGAGGLAAWLLNLLK
jgi:hypothetical protein